VIATDLTLPQETANKLGPAASAFQLDVTRKSRILCRLWPMTKKQYRTPNVTVGTVKKPVAQLPRDDSVGMSARVGWGRVFSEFAGVIAKQ
jgi:hypothetical protein